MQLPRLRNILFLYEAPGIKALPAGMMGHLAVHMYKVVLLLSGRMHDGRI